MSGFISSPHGHEGHKENAF